MHMVIEFFPTLYENDIQYSKGLLPGLEYEGQGICGLLFSGTLIIHSEETLHKYIETPLRSLKNPLRW